MSVYRITIVRVTEDDLPKVKKFAEDNDNLVFVEEILSDLYDPAEELAANNEKWAKETLLEYVNGFKPEAAKSAHMAAEYLAQRSEEKRLRDLAAEQKGTR